MSKSGHLRQPATVAKTKLHEAGAINHKSDGVITNRQALHPFLMASGDSRKSPLVAFTGRPILLREAHLAKAGDSENFILFFKLKVKLQPQRKEHVPLPGFPFISLNVLQIKAASSQVKASPDSLLFTPHGSAHLSTAIYRLHGVTAGSEAAVLL